MADQDGVLILDLYDVYGERIKDHADIMLTHQVFTDRRVVRNVDTSKRIRIPNLYSVPQGLYKIEVDPLGYLPVGQFVTVAAGKGTTLAMTFPVDPDKVVDSSFPEYSKLPEQVRRILEGSSTVVGYENKLGAELYAALDTVRKAGMMNIISKCSNVVLTSGFPVVNYIQSLFECRGDRLYARVDSQLRNETINSVADHRFFEAPEGLHHIPGYEGAKSYKTTDRYGNLQLSFFTNGTEWAADIDIDDANGLEHVFQVLRNALHQRTTHPYDIHEILVAYQKIDPEYRLLV